MSSWCHNLRTKPITCVPANADLTVLLCITLPLHFQCLVSVTEELGTIHVQADKQNVKELAYSSGAPFTEK